MKIILYLLLLSLFSGCLSTQEKRLLQIMEESEKTVESDVIKECFRKQYFGEIYTLPNANYISSDKINEIIYNPEYFILNPSKDSCVVFYSVDFPFLVDTSEKHPPSKIIYLFMMTCVNINNKWTILKTEDNKDCVASLIDFTPYFSEDNKNAFLKNEKRFVKKILDDFSYTDCSYGTTSDIKKYLKSKYWFD